MAVGRRQLRLHGAVRRRVTRWCLPLTFSPRLLHFLAGADSQPDWLDKIWVRLSQLRSLLDAEYTRSTETKIRTLIAKHVPDYAQELLDVNIDDDSLHMEFLRESLVTGHRRFFERAMQYGLRNATYPLLFSWAAMDTNLRKYVVYCFVHHQRDRPTLPLLPCSRLQFIDYLEWLPHNGINVGWSSIRHYAGRLITWSKVCGFGGIVGDDPTGYDVWQQNFAANVQVARRPRGGDIPLRPWHLRRLAAVYNGSGWFDKMMLSVLSLLWFTALRPGHFSPKSDTPEGFKHMLQWAHGRPYQTVCNGSSRDALHIVVPSTKSAQKNEQSAWTTAVCCICESADADADERRALCRVCPTHSLDRWRRVAPKTDYVFSLPDGKPFLRHAFNKELRRGLRLALSYLDSDALETIVSQISAKSFRSGAATVIVTAGNADFIAADFLGHSDPKITKQYYHKAGDDERLGVVPSLAAGLRLSRGTPRETV